MWPKASAFLATHAIEPAEYIESMFSDAFISGIPHPNMISSETSLSKYRDYVQHAAQRARTQLDAQKMCFLLEVEKTKRLTGDDLESASLQVLQDTSLSLTVLFRYCMLANCSSDLSKKYREAALQCLVLGYFALTAGWAEFIPDELIDEAAGIIAILCEG